jgi:hypothetical protein
VRNVVAGFATAWNRHDMKAFGKLFAIQDTSIMSQCRSRTRQTFANAGHKADFDPMPK